MTHFKKFYSSIILLVIGGFILNSQVRFGDGCAGMVGAISFIFWVFVYVVVLLVVLARNLIKFPSRVNTNPIWTTFIVLASIFIAFNRDKFESSAMLTAETYDHSPGYYLKLRENGSFVASIGHADWSCYYNGNYQLKNDTLTLSRHDIQQISDGGLSDIYLIDREKNKLYPLDRYDRDTTYWLSIVPNE